jgi:putative transposase
MTATTRHRCSGGGKLKRTNVVKLMVDKCTGDRLRELGVATAKCWNEVNWLRMQQ